MQNKNLKYKIVGTYGDLNILEIQKDKEKPFYNLFKKGYIPSGDEGGYFYLTSLIVFRCHNKDLLIMKGGFKK
jgi:hypothetical protein